MPAGHRPQSSMSKAGINGRTPQAHRFGFGFHGTEVFKKTTQKISNNKSHGLGRLNCRIETAKAVLEAKADYLLCAKSNQQTLKADIEEYVQDDRLRSKMNRITKREKGHGRIETRSAFTTNDVSWMPGDNGRE